MVCMAGHRSVLSDGLLIKAATVSAYRAEMVAGLLVGRHRMPQGGEDGIPHFVQKVKDLRSCEVRRFPFRSVCVDRRSVHKK